MHDQDYIWDVVYHMDGRGLSDYLNDFHNTEKYDSSQYGERVWTEDGFKFDAWSKWAEEVSYYFNGLFDAVAEFEESTEDNHMIFDDEDIIDILVFGVCKSLHLVNDAKNTPKNYDKFLFC